MPQPRNFRDLHVAVAWVVTLDEGICREVEYCGRKADEQFAEIVEKAMSNSECFEHIDNDHMAAVDTPRPVPVPGASHKLRHGYTGRFLALAKEYEIRRQMGQESPYVNLRDFLLHRWRLAFQQILDCMADGKLGARGVEFDGLDRIGAREIPSASVTDSMFMDLSGAVWEAPPRTTGRQPKRWHRVKVSWPELLTCFKPVTGREIESECHRWLEQEMRKSPDRRPFPRRIYLERAQEEFRGIRPASFANAWKFAIKTTGATAWSDPGRPKKPPLEKTSSNK